MTKRPGCGGSCHQVDFPCDCDVEVSMWDIERTYPWILWVYGIVAVLTIAASALWSYP